MSNLKADGQFLRKVFAILIFATMVCLAGVVFTLLAIPSPPASMSVSYYAP
jgi:uncharacterized protein involved in exopolysaccharide biosynthesis